MVEYDSIIPPGQEGNVIQQLKVKKLKSGTFTKAVKVMSNARNSEVFRLSLSGKILSVINISSRFIHLRPDTVGNFSGTLTLNTEKKNFTVKEITFKENKGSGPEWQQQPILYLKHSMTRTDSADNDGYYTYTLIFSLDITPAKRLSGTFALKTNHPKRDTIDIRGMISPPEEIKK